MPNKIQLRGFDELAKEFASLPGQSTQDADPILAAHAQKAHAAVLDAYPTGPTGNLEKGVRLRRGTGRKDHVARWNLASTAPHAHLYEFGTVKQEPRPTFLRIAEHEQREAVIEVAAMMEAKGLDVRGERD